MSDFSVGTISFDITFVDIIPNSLPTLPWFDLFAPI